MRGKEGERKGERESPPTYTVSNPGTMVIESLYTVITDRAVRRSKIKLFDKNRHIFKQIVCQLWWEPLCLNYMYWVSQKSQVKKVCRDFWLTQYQFWIHWTLFWNQLHEGCRFVLYLLLTIISTFRCQKSPLKDELQNKNDLSSIQKTIIICLPWWSEYFAGKTVFELHRLSLHLKKK